MVTEQVVATFGSIIIKSASHGKETYYTIYRSFDEEADALGREGYIEFSDDKHNWVLTTEDDDTMPGLDAADLVLIAEFMLGIESVKPKEPLLGTVVGFHHEKEGKILYAHNTQQGWLVTEASIYSWNDILSMMASDTELTEYTLYVND